MRLALVLSAALALLVAACGDGDGTPSNATPGPLTFGETVDVRIGDAVFHAEVADTAGERSMGLSGRESLGRDDGMLFVYTEDAGPSVWMKDMRFPLDIVWISAEPRVTAVEADVPNPEPGTPDSELPNYLPPAPVRYFLEINAGVAAERGIGPGDEVTFEP